MWISPKSTVLFVSDDPSFNNPALGWVGPASEGACGVLPAGSYETRLSGPQLPAGRSQHDSVGGRKAGLMKITTRTLASRRRFLGATAAAGAAAFLRPARGAAQKITKTQVWVQLTTGGKPYPPTFQEMFLDPMFFGMEIWPIDQPASFAALQPAPPATAACAAAFLRRRAGARSVAAPSVTNRRTIRGNRAAGARIPATTSLCLNDQMDWPEATRNLAQPGG